MRLFPSLLCAVAIAAPTGARAAGPTARFEWSLPERFGLDRDGDGLVDYSTAHDYLYPPSWTVNFDACSSTAGDSPIVRYDWDLAGLAQVSTESCAMPHPPSAFPEQGPYWITLTVTAADGQAASVRDTIVIKDLLIVSIGDSYASGEGNPDIPQGLDRDLVGFDFATTPASWIDRRCARSAYSSHAQAAIAIERADPHTSVTFLSYACSGASVLNGLLGNYDGIEPPDGPHLPLPPQISAVALALCPGKGTTTTCPDRSSQRPIDALLISIGGNDLGFADIVLSLVAEVDGDKDPNVRAIFDAKLALLPDLYRQVGQAIRDQLNVDTVYIGEYPDPTTDADGAYCANSPVGDPLSGIGAEESRWASTTVIPALNGAVRDAAAANGWIYVGGIASQFARHGWCAGPFDEFIHDSRWSAYADRQRWMRTYEDSRYTQGPFDLAHLADTHGTMHPNAQGLAAIGAALAAYVRDPGPKLAEFDGLVPFAIDRQGDDGWLTGSCPVLGGDCSDASAYLTVTIQSSKGISSPRPASCGASGITCTYQVLDSRGGVVDEASWIIALSADGEHSITVDAKDPQGKAGALVTLAKVDLHDPLASASVRSGTLGNGGWYRSPVDVELLASDEGSGVKSIVYRIDADPVLTSAPTGASTRLSVPVSLRTDGEHSLSFQSFDRAGRSSAPRTLALNIDATPPAVSTAPSRPPDAAGWYNHPFQVAWFGADALSGLGGCDASAGYAGPDLGAGSISGTCSDMAGNEGSAAYSFRYDSTPPIVTWSGNAGTYAVDQTVDISCSASDALSGIASKDCAAIIGPAYSFDLGVNTFSASAADNAANSTSAQTTFTVLVTSDSLSNLTAQFVQDAGVAQSLLLKLAAGHLGAYEREVAALAGKKLTAQQAAILIRLAQAL